MNGLSEAFIIVTLSAAVYLLLSSFVMKTFGKRDRVMEIQKEMNEMNKEHREALKGGDKERLARAEKNYGRMMPLLTESMMLQFRPLIVLLPILFIIPPFLRGQYPAFQIKLPIPLPVPFPLDAFINRFPNARDVFGAVGWFWIFVVFGGLLLQPLTNFISKLMGKDKKEERKEINK